MAMSVRMGRHSAIFSAGVKEKRRKARTRSGGNVIFNSRLIKSTFSLRQDVLIKANLSVCWDFYWTLTFKRGVKSQVIVTMWGENKTGMSDISPRYIAEKGRSGFLSGNS